MTNKSQLKTLMLLLLAYPSQKIFYNSLSCLLSTMGISGSEKRINKEGWNSKLREKWSNLGSIFGQKSLK